MSQEVNIYRGPKAKKKSTKQRGKFTRIAIVSVRILVRDATSARKCTLLWAKVVYVLLNDWPPGMVISKPERV